MLTVIRHELCKAQLRDLLLLRSSILELFNWSITISFLSVAPRNEIETYLSRHSFSSEAFNFQIWNVNIGFTKRMCMRYRVLLELDQKRTSPSVMNTNQGLKVSPLVQPISRCCFCPLHKWEIRTQILLHTRDSSRPVPVLWKIRSYNIKDEINTIEM